MRRNNLKWYNSPFYPKGAHCPHKVLLPSGKLFAIRQSSYCVGDRYMKKYTDRLNNDNVFFNMIHIWYNMNSTFGNIES